MCLSPEADLVVGAAVVVVGIDALRQVRSPRDLPLAALPLILGVHLLVEVPVWLGLRGELPVGVEQVAEWLYLVIALAVVPAIVPAAVARSEPGEGRARLRPFVVLGAVVAAWLLLAVVRGQTVARLRHLHIAYFVDAPLAEVAAVAYVVATCGPALLSRRPAVRAFGVVNLVAVLVLSWLVLDGVVSLWCAWAAVTSVVVDVYLRRARPVASPRVEARA